MSTRRSFLTSLLAAAVFGARGLALESTLPPAGRKLALRVKADGFGGAGVADIKAVLNSVADEIWQYCPHTRFAQRGFEIYHNSRDKDKTLAQHLTEWRANAPAEQRAFIARIAAGFGVALEP